MIVAWLALQGCAGGDPLDDYGVEIVNPGSGEPNTAPLHPFTEGMTWIDGARLIRLDGGVTLEGRELMRMRVGGVADAVSEVWQHRDDAGIWLDGSPADGLLETPLLLVPEPVRAGMTWKQRVELDGGSLEVTGWIDRDPDDPTRWVVNRQQNDRAPTATPYTEGEGPHQLVFLPHDPTDQPVAAPGPSLTPLQVLAGAPVLEAVAFTEDGQGLRGGAEAWTLATDPMGLLPPSQQVLPTGLFAFPGERPVLGGEPDELPGTAEPEPVIEAYRADARPLGGTSRWWTHGGEAWQLMAPIVPHASRVRLDGGGYRYVAAMAGGTVDVVGVEADGVLRRRRLGRLPLEQGRHLRAAWLRADGFLEGLFGVQEPQGTFGGEAEWFLAQPLAQGDEVPVGRWVEGARWDADVEVCWTGGGNGSGWLLDGVAPAAVVPTRPGCALLVRDWTGQTADTIPTESEVQGTVEGLGAFTRRGITTNAVAHYARWGRTVTQPDGAIVAIDGDAGVFRGPGGLHGGRLAWPSSCIADAVEGCWVFEPQGGNSDTIRHIGPSGTTELGTFDYADNPWTPAAGGLIIRAGYGTNDRIWLRADGTQQPFAWQAPTRFDGSFDGSTACYFPSGAYDLHCRDLLDGDDLFVLPAADIEVTRAVPLPTGLLLWPYDGEAWLLDRSSWTAAPIPGDLTGAHYGGALADGSVWGWRRHPEQWEERQLIRVTSAGAQVATLPIPLADREAIVGGSGGTVEADDDLVYWVRTQQSPTYRSWVVRIAWDALDWEDL